MSVNSIILQSRVSPLIQLCILSNWVSLQLAGKKKKKRIQPAAVPASFITGKISEIAAIADSISLLAQDPAFL